MKPLFDHEKLKAYEVAVAFNAWVGVLLQEIVSKAAVKDQLDRAATSIPLNIAEGNGKFSSKDRARYFDIARGSALESAACLDVLRVRELATSEALITGKRLLFEIVNMLMGLLRRFGYEFGRDPESSVIREESGEFREQEQEQDKE